MPQAKVVNREVDLVEAAVRMKCSWHTAYRLVLVGKLKGVRRNGRWWVEEASLEQLTGEPQLVDRAAGRAASR